jgi:sterol desaturase/sphingolipid hydroxylase (fatty acid hydroxylase superfamily)
MGDVLDPWANPVTYGVPFFLLAIALELLVLNRLGRDGDVTGYQGKDAATSLLMGAGSLVTISAVKVAGFVAYTVVYAHVALWHLPMRTWWSWVLAIVGVDLAYYWYHRFTHRVRVGWAAHQAHHSSEYMNFGTALRQKWNPWFDFFFWLPLPLLGVPPWALYVAYGFNLVYQFFIHTELVKKLPRPVEFIFNTPSHHRVHHGSDPVYLDRNYGGILILWDRAFRTFQPELHRPAYGLTRPVGTHNLITLQYGEFAALWRDIRSARSWQDRLGYAFMPPEWQPSPLRNTVGHGPAGSQLRSRQPVTEPGIGPIRMLPRTESRPGIPTVRKLGRRSFRKPPAAHPSATRPAHRAARRPTRRPPRRTHRVPGRQAPLCCRSARRSGCRWSARR